MRRPVPIARVAMLALLALAPLCAPQAPAAAAPVAAAPALPERLARVSVLGASLSGGTGNLVELELRRDLRLGGFLAAALTAEGAAISDHGDTWFFMKPETNGAEQVDAALEEEPTLVVALDFLFWYAYGGRHGDDDARLAGLRRGFAQLDRLDCPLVVADLPDITAALQGVGPLGGPLVSPDMFPTPDGLDRINAAVRAWAERRGDVVVVPLRAFLDDVRSGAPLALRGNEWTVEDVREALQADLLHPTVRGTIWVLLATLDALTAARDDVPASAFHWDEATLRERVLAATAEEREAVRERARRREERRKRREERRKEEGGGAPLAPAAG